MPTSEFSVAQSNEVLFKTCKALQLSTRQRVVWVAALHRVCIDNTLFLPSFPISDMSVLDLERTAMAPRRWIELCGAFEKQHRNDPLRPRATRMINVRISNAMSDIFIVPGGRYLVTPSPRNSVSVLDLGCTSSAESASVDCKLIASVKVGHKYDTCKVQATPDGMGLTIYLSSS